MEPGWPRMDPEFTKNGAKIEKSALKRLKLLPDGSQDHFCQEVSPIFINFWVPSGTQKSTKNRSLAQKGVSGSVFLSIFLANGVFLTFGLDFSSIFDEKSMKKWMHFFKAARNFFNMAMV